MTEVPLAVSVSEFAVSPGFAGAAAVVAALIVLCAVLYGIRRADRRFNQDQEQRERHQQEAREADQNAVAIRQCRDTLKWVVETAGIEPAASEGATLGLGPELALALLRGLRSDAERLGDQTLVDAVTVYQKQFALVLARQGGPLSGLASATPESVDGRPGNQPGSSTDAKRATTSGAAPDRRRPAPGPDENPTATTEVTAGRRRRQ